MKTLKRFLSLTLVCLLLCGLLPSFALADDSAAGALVLTDVAGKPGDTVTVDLQLTSNPGIVVLQIKSLSFDSTVLKLKDVAVSFESGWNQTVVKETGGILLDKDPRENSTYTGAVATYTFEILDTAAAGKTKIGLDYIACDTDENYVTFDVTPATVTVEGEAEKPIVTAYGGSLSLDGDIALNFCLIIPDEVFEDEESYVTLNDQKTLIKGAKSVVQSGQTMYEFKYRLAAKQMNDTVVLHVYGGDDQLLPLQRTSGRDITEAGYSYSVQRYIQLVLKNGGSTQLVALMKAMSDYGNKAQFLFNYNVENVVDLYNSDAINAVTANDLVAYKRVTTKTDRTGIKYAYVNLTLESVTTARLFFTVNEGTIDDYSFTLNGMPVTPFLTSNGYAVEIPNIAAKDLDLMNTVEVSDSEGVCLTVRYSALSYAYLVVNTNNLDDIKNIEACKALYLYNQAANDYFGA